MTTQIQTTSLQLPLNIHDRAKHAIASLGSRAAPLRSRVHVTVTTPRKPAAPYPPAGCAEVLEQQGPYALTPTPQEVGRGSRRAASATDSGDSSTAILDFTVSNESLDRYGEIISANGWQLANYKRNPVFQNAHQYGDIIHTLGKALITDVAGSELVQRVQFAVEANPIARIAYALYKDGFLNAVSVGFVPLRWEDGGPKSKFRRRYLEQELLEVSAVAIPANPDALRLGYQAGAVNAGDLRDAAELLSALASQAKTTPPHPAKPTQPETLRELARRLRDVLRGS